MKASSQQGFRVIRQFVPPSRARPGQTCFARSARFVLARRETCEGNDSRRNGDLHGSSTRTGNERLAGATEASVSILLLRSVRRQLLRQGDSWPDSDPREDGSESSP